VPAGAEKLDWEVELGFLVCREAKRVPVEDALQYVAGYCTVIDVSERCWQFERGGQLGKGKSHDSFTPVGPWLVTRDEVSDPQNLHLWLDVGEEARQRGTTAEMLFSIAELVAHLSTYQTLLPGDLVITGTPAGVALGMEPPLYLKVGEELSCGISGLGEQCHRVELDG
jgi:2-keto-4-pentenoate hydratase/2-oxohepta-3-ene-1,7-dioic acid hydratase in catechol pathway